MIFFKLVDRAWQLFWKNRQFVPLFVVVDVVFVVGMTFVQKEVFEKATRPLLKLMSVVQEETTKALAGAALPAQVFQTPEFISAANEVLKYVVLAILYGFIVWTTTKGTQWFLANKIVKKKVCFVAYALKFVMMNAFWLLAFLVVVTAGINLVDYAFFQPLALFGPGIAYFLTWAFLFVLAYFAFISYSLPPKPVFKQTFSLGIKKWRTLLPVHVVNSLIVFVATTLPASFLNKNLYVALGIAVFAGLPALAFGRVYWVVAVQAVKKSFYSSRAS